MLNRFSGNQEKHRSWILEYNWRFRYADNNAAVQEEHQTEVMPNDMKSNEKVKPFEILLHWFWLVYVGLLEPMLKEDEENEEKWIRERSLAVDVLNSLLVVYSLWPTIDGFIFLIFILNFSNNWNKIILCVSFIYWS